MKTVETTKDLVEKIYQKTEYNLKKVKAKSDRPLTLSEKILFGHLANPESQKLARGEAILGLRPDRVAMQDATAQMAILQFLSSGKDETAVPTTVHCDHLIRAHSGSKIDMKTALDEHREVYDFLRSACAKCGIGFWEPGAGIIHQVVLEHYAFPGLLMIGTDSHTPNAGGLGGLAVGVGGADAVDVMAGFPWEVKHPKLIGVHLTGELSGWAAPKDIICELCGILTTKGGTNHIVEYFGPGVKTISATGKGTITNMGAELGATTSVFPFDDAMDRYLRATQRKDLAELAQKYRHLLIADLEIEKDPEKYFDRVIEIDLSTLEPRVVGPHSPDVVHPISRLAEDTKKAGWPEKFTAALIGSCTNSSYEDICRATDVAKQAAEKGLKSAVPFYVTPGSDQIYQTIKRDGQLAALEEIGGTVLANACGPCIGQWKRDDYKKGETNAILSSYNRNFPARNDGNPETLSFLTSPEIVVAMALSGRLTFNPVSDTLDSDKGPVRLKSPQKAPDLPSEGFAESKAGFVPPPPSGQEIKVAVAPDSKRLQILKPFPKWDGKDFEKLPLLLKAKGKCTTDHISPAGVWLKFRGHLDNISDNMFTGAVNSFTDEMGMGKNLLTGETSQPFPKIARSYKEKGQRWIAVGGDNYGEGSSREHAAMSPRHLGAAAVITKSFARIHETNLKKQGVLPLTFANPQDYDKVKQEDRVSVLGLASLAPNHPLEVVLHHADGKEDRFSVKHSLTDEQISWFKAGSALNVIRTR